MATRPRRSQTAGSGPLGALAAHLAARRRSLGLTQRELAELADVGLRTLQALETGSSGVRVATLLRVVEALGLGVVVLPRSRAAALGAEDSAAAAPSSTTVSAE